MICGNENCRFPSGLRILTALGLFATVVLSAAAVWLGALNQDEGWYLYAANLVSEGKVPYADFAFTQGPVLPVVYSVFSGIWKSWGLLGARVFTVALGLVGIAFAALTARRMAGGVAALIVFILLGSNLYHLYYLAIPKTYALAALFVSVGFYLLTYVRDRRAALRIGAAVLSGASFALAAGTRISLGAILAVVGAGLLVDAASSPRRKADVSCHVGRGRGPASTWSFLWFGLGGVVVLAIVYGSFLFAPAAREGLLAAQKYHAARGGFDLVLAVGSLSRLVRWYLPVFVLLGLGVAKSLVDAARRRDAARAPRPQDIASAGKATSTGEATSASLDKDQPVRCTPIFHPYFLPATLLASFLAVFVVQILAPFPYEDYQVPIMSLLAIVTAVTLVDATSSSRRKADVSCLVGRGEDAASTGDQSVRCTPIFYPYFLSPILLPLLALGLAWASSFGSPLLEKWMTNGQDRFWSLKKPQPELAQLRKVAREIERLDPNGTEILTQDLYLAIEMNRKVPHGLEMGPFSVLTDAEWRKLLGTATCPVAALSGYSFAVNPPVCDERPLRDQLEYWEILKGRYELAFREEAFGQNATTLLVLKRK